jgi:hypothetical protein
MASQTDHCWRCQTVYRPTSPEAHDVEALHTSDDLKTAAAAA